MYYCVPYFMVFMNVSFSVPAWTHFPHNALDVVLSSALKRDFTGVNSVLWSVLCFMLTVSGSKPADNHKIHCDCMLATES